MINLEYYQATQRRYSYDDGVLVHKCNPCPTVIGKPVHISHDKAYQYIKLRVNGKAKKLPVHRVIWFIHHGAIPKDLVIDHIDRDPSNNSINNLRLVTMKQNAENRSMMKNNTSGFRGVHYDITNKVFKASIRHHNIVMSLGTFSNPKEASRAYETKRKELFTHGGR